MLGDRKIKTKTIDLEEREIKMMERKCNIKITNNNYNNNDCNKYKWKLCQIRSK